MERNVRKLPMIPKRPKSKKVAAYARVSCGKDAMLHSLSAQVSYYSNLIQNYAGWDYAGVYADEALTGTKDNRAEFQRLLTACRAGEVDVIITKSISRFARNTVTLLETVRELKLLGIDVYFEEQNIHTMSGEGELMLTILASYAQEESLSASENVKWQIRKGFENGELINLRFLYGYQVKRGQIEIDSASSLIVKEVFERTLGGESLSSIAKDFEKRCVPTMTDGEWSALRIREILSNEKYTGNALLQKSYINNHIEKKKCINNGELPMYYAEQTHPAIIDIETFRKAQEILKEKAEKWKQKKPEYNEFSKKIICSGCGKPYKRIMCRGVAGWNCSTVIRKSAAFCHGKKIPEVTLRSVKREVLALSEYDPSVFLEKVDNIEVPEDFRLIYHLRDGRSVPASWQEHSRRDSWTEEMKETARRRTIEQRRNERCQKR